MAITAIITPSTKIDVQSGKGFRIDAEVEGSVSKQEKQISWLVSSGPVVSKGNGLFQAEKVESDTNVKIECFAAANKTISIKFDITIVSPEVQILPSKKIKCFSNTQIQFETKCGGIATNNRWEIISENFYSGSIDQKGLYSSPEIAKKTKTITVRVTDQNSGKVALAKVQLIPVSLMIGKQPIIVAGEKNVQLNIVSRHDKEGIKNFKCRVLTPEGGSIQDGGIYTPPSILAIEKKVTIEVKSKLNKSLKKTFEITVELAKCKKCHEDVISSDNSCPKCGEPIGSANTLKQILKDNGRI
ncbi:MAG: hypothetical protein PF572_01380 [Patescibacteria group bacterium]|jgi:hypothetical protein|nr:hypothetical protein [Patescibacteria group bacterium]